MNDSYAKDKNNINVIVPNAYFDNLFVAACCVPFPSRDEYSVPLLGEGSDGEQHYLRRPPLSKGA